MTTERETLVRELAEARIEAPRDTWRQVKRMIAELELGALDASAAYADRVEAQHAAQDRAEAAERARDSAYTERNRLVAALSKLYPAGLKRTAIEGWDPAWHGCVIIDAPVGQLSWHFHDREAALFAHLGPYTGEWDGHTTEEKYARLERLTPDAKRCQCQWEAGDSPCRVHGEDEPAWETAEEAT